MKGSKEGIKLTTNDCMELIANIMTMLEASGDTPQIRTGERIKQDYGIHSIERNGNSPYIFNYRKLQ